jgi:hypothetical protein
MLGRFLILVAMMLFGPLFIEVYLYHPLIALEHDTAAIVPLVASPLAIFSGFLVLAADRRATTWLLGLVCIGAIGVGVTGTAIHMALHASSLTSLVTDPNVWLGNPPPLVPLSFAAAGCLGLIPVALPRQRQLAEPPVAIARILYAMASLCGLAAAIGGVLSGIHDLGGTIGLFAVIAALGFGSFGYMAEIGVIAFTIWRGRTA